MPRRVKKRPPRDGFSKSTRALHASKERLARETYSMKGITKKYALFGKARQQALSADAKQEIRDACESVLLAAQCVMEECEVLDAQRSVTDRLARALWRLTKQAAQTSVFVPARESPCW
jgi:hypothetical protein